MLDATNWTKLAQDRDPVKGHCEHDNEASGSIKYLEILGRLGDL
jgi:hypothetical protein